MLLRKSSRLLGLSSGEVPLHKGNRLPGQAADVDLLDRRVEKAIQARNGMVVSVSPPGTDVGVSILKRGGNAVDAAVATAFGLAVTWPSAGNLGGGGFMVIHPSHGKGPPVVIDYRETAPLVATRSLSPCSSSGRIPHCSK